MNVPNCLTVLRAVLTVIMVCFWYDPAGWYDGRMPIAFTIALVLFIVGSVTDFLDGYIARKKHIVTSFGKIADPIADKALTLCAMWCIVDHVDSTLGFVFIGIIVLREVAVTVFRMFALKKGKVLAAGWPGKVKTAVQMVMLILCFLFIISNERNYSFTGSDTLGIGASCCVLLGITVFFTVYSGVYYFVKGFKILGAKPENNLKKAAK